MKRWRGEVVLEESEIRAEIFKVDEKVLRSGFKCGSFKDVFKVMLKM